MEPEGSLPHSQASATRIWLHHSFYSTFEAGLTPPALSGRENLWTEISDYTIFRFTTTLHVPTQISVKK
jgi:hypothetical protein